MALLSHARGAYCKAELQKSEIFELRSCRLPHPAINFQQNSALFGRTRGREHEARASEGRISPGHDAAIAEQCCKGACIRGDVLSLYRGCAEG